LVWNDFWLRHKNYNVEPEDRRCSWKMRRDTIRVSEITRRLQCGAGRNEGVPQPILNQGLEELDADGGRNAVLHADFEPGEFTKQGPYK